MNILNDSFIGKEVKYLTPVTANSLTDVELLAKIIGNNDNANKLLSIYEFGELPKLNINQLITAGLTNKQAQALIYTSNFYARQIGAEVRQKNKIRSSRDIYNIMLPFYIDAYVEKFYVILLNSANKIINIELISTGGLTGTLADPKIIFKKALEQNTISLILLHNHPSGNVEPSEADIQLTSKFYNAAKLLDIVLIDHIIIGGNDKYYSWRDNGLNF